jgi:hypothetical protein
MTRIAVVVLATQLANSSIPVPSVSKLTRQHGRFLLLAAAFLGLAERQLEQSGANLQARPWLPAQQVVPVSKV